MCVSSSLKHNRNPVSDHSLRLFEYLPIGTPDTKHCGIYYLENCVVTPYSTDVRPCCFTLKMRNGTTLRSRPAPQKPALHFTHALTRCAARSLSAESERSRVAWIQTFVEVCACRPVWYAPALTCGGFAGRSVLGDGPRA